MISNIGRTISAFALLICIYAIAGYANDLQNWNDNLISVKTGEKSSFTIYNRSKFSRSPFTESYSACIQFGLSQEIFPGAFIQPAYRYEIVNKTAYYEFENRFYLQFVYKDMISNIANITLAQRTELRHFTATTEDHIRLRLKLSFSRKLTMYKGRFASPYVGGEIFYDDIQDRIYRFRFYLGAKYGLGARYALRLGVIIQNERNKDDISILNTGVDLKF